MLCPILLAVSKFANSKSPRITVMQVNRDEVLVLTYIFITFTADFMGECKACFWLMITVCHSSRFCYNLCYGSVF